MFTLSTSALSDGGLSAALAYSVNGMDNFCCCTGGGVDSVSKNQTVLLRAKHGNIMP